MNTTQHCQHCKRERPEYIADPSCAKGGYCEWVEVQPVEAKETCYSWCPETGQKCTGKRCIGANCEKARERQIKEEGEEYEKELIAIDDVLSAYPVVLAGYRKRTVDCCHGIDSPVCLSPGQPGHEPRCAWMKAGEGEFGHCELQANHGGFHLYQLLPRPIVLDAFWLTPQCPGQCGQILTWRFEGKAIVESFEVEGKPAAGGRARDFNGFITSLRVGNEELLRLGPYPISMFSLGMPKVEAWLPHVPVGWNLTVSLDHFYGRIRPIGLVIPSSERKTSEEE